MSLKRWEAALAPVRLGHIDPTCEPFARVYGDAVVPTLIVAVKNARDTTNQDKRIAQLTVSCVELRWFPGERLARAWLAAAWAGYVQHEALELVSIGSVRILDPHLEPRIYDRGLQCGFPLHLTPETMLTTLSLVMDQSEARAMIEEVTNAY